MRSNFALGHSDLTGHHGDLLNSRVTASKWKSTNETLVLKPKQDVFKCYEYQSLSETFFKKHLLTGT